jgi:hypothetical protein
METLEELKFEIFFLLFWTPVILSLLFVDTL